MNNLNCEYVRDVYPDVLSGAADALVADVVRDHLATCADCREEAALIAALQHAPAPVVPAGLHERVVQSTARPRARWRIHAGDVAMAATLAAALIGGGIYLQQQKQPLADAPAPAAVRPAHSLGAVGVEDALMTGKSSLDDLSVEQLEKLLGEVQS